MGNFLLNLKPALQVLDRLVPAVVKQLKSPHDATKKKVILGL